MCFDETLFQQLFDFVYKSPRRIQHFFRAFFAGMSKRRIIAPFPCRLSLSKIVQVFCIHPSRNYEQLTKLGDG